MEQIALNDGENLRDQPRKEASETDGERHNTFICDDADSVVGSPLGAVRVGRQRVYGSGGTTIVGQRKKARFYQPQAGCVKQASLDGGRSVNSG